MICKYSKNVKSNVHVWLGYIVAVNDENIRKTKLTHSMVSIRMIAFGLEGRGRGKEGEGGV